MSVLEAAVGWLAPPECIGCGNEGASLCPACCIAEIVPFGARCWHCGALTPKAKTCDSCSHLRGPRHVWIRTDYEGVAKDLVSLYKFGEVRVAAAPIANLIIECFRFFNDDDQIEKADYLIVPVPTATSRIRHRGFDHCRLLGKNITRILKLDYSSALGRIGHQRQVGSRKVERLTKPHDNYFVRRPTEIAGRNILLIDDVITTGGTLIVAAKLLRAAGAKRVDALVFAKSR